MNDEAGAWLDALTAELAARDMTGPPIGRAEILAGCLADTVTAAGTLCQLWSASGALVGAELSVEFAITYKSRNLATLQHLARLTRDCLPEMTEAAALGFAGTSMALVAGTWPYVRPTAAIAEAIEVVGFPSVSKDYPLRLSRILTAQAVGVLVGLGTRL
jgi:hypothetical protein